MRRLRVRFTLRQVMLLVLVCGAILGWMKLRHDRAAAQRRAVAAVRETGGHEAYDYQYSNGEWIKGGKPWSPAWLRRYLGDEYFQEVTSLEWMGPSKTL